MTKEQALFEFWSSFDVTAYPSTNVPIDVTFPYIVYEVATSSFMEGEVNTAVSIWYKTESEKIPNEKANEISEAIGRSGVCIQTDDGYIWFKKGSPFCQNLADADDNTVKLRQLNITIEYFTKN